MSLRDYNEPVRYQPPPPPPPRQKLNVKPLLLVCGVVTLVVGGAIWWGVAAMRNVMRDTGLFPDKPKAAVITGTPLVWRELGGATGFGPLGSSLVVGDFSGNGDDDLLVIDPIGEIATQYDLSGASQQYPGWTESLFCEKVAWDYDGDGKAEIAYGMHEEVLVLDITGQQVATLPYRGFQLSTADVDGDGHDDLIVERKDSFNILALDTKGEGLHNYTGIKVYALFADVDGDGLEEMYAGAEPNNRCPIIHHDGTRQEVAKPPGYDILAVFKTSDDELRFVVGNFSHFTAGGELAAIYDPAIDNLAFITLPPVSQAVKNSSQDAGLDVVMLNAGGTQAPQIAIVRGGMTNATSLMLFSTDGQLQYHEEFGEVVHAMEVATAGGREHLVVLTSSRVLVYP